MDNVSDSRTTRLNSSQACSGSLRHIANEVLPAVAWESNFYLTFTPEFIPGVYTKPITQATLRHIIIDCACEVE